MKLYHFVYNNGLGPKDGGAFLTRNQAYRQGAAFGGMLSLKGVHANKVPERGEWSIIQRELGHSDLFGW